MASTHCHLLEICAELRNIIYELSFTSNIKEGTIIDITSAPAPSPALLLTSHQISTEATPLYYQANEDFWKTGRFHKEIKNNHDEAAINVLRDQDLFHVTRLSLDFDCRTICTNYHPDSIGHCMANLVRFDNCWIVRRREDCLGQWYELDMVSQHKGHKTMHREFFGEEKEKLDRVQVLKTRARLGKAPECTVKEQIALMLKSLGFRYR